MIVYNISRIRPGISKSAVDPSQTTGRKGWALTEVHTPNVGSIEAVCGFLKVKPQELIKTLIYKADAEVFAALVAATAR